MKRPAIFQDTVRATRCRATAIDPTKEAPAANHHPEPAPMAVCPDAAESANVVTLSAVGGHFHNSRSLQACQPLAAALASEASGMDDLASEASGETRLTYSALVALASEGGGMDDTLMPRLPPARGLDLNDGAILCEDCGMWLNGVQLYSDHLIGKKHRSSLKQKAGSGPCIPPAPFPM